MAILHEHIEGKYEILGKLREGGMGAVYKVRHRLLGEIRVVKVLNSRLDATPELNDRFLREARFAIQLRHPNIAQLHDFSIAEDGTAFIVMEHIDGANLEEIVGRGGPPPLGLALEVARQALKAIGFLHRKGLIHRDVSPDNLMLTRDAEGEPLVKLIDLGIAKGLQGATGRLTMTGMFLGKPRYASPEQLGAEGMAGVDSRADLYSFGVVLYELLTGVCPIQGRDPSSLMAGHLFRPPVAFAVSDPQGRLPAELRAIVLRSLEKNPDDRYPAAEELGGELRGVQGRYPMKPGELEAALLAASSPANPSSPPPGSTQDRLDQHFAMVPTPAPTAPGERRRERTLVLVPPVAATTLETPVVQAPREPTPAPAAAETVAAPPRQEAPPPQAPAPASPAPQSKMPESPPPRLRPAAEPKPTGRRRDVAAAVLVLGLATAALGFWGWRSSRAAPEETRADPGAPSLSAEPTVTETAPQTPTPAPPETAISPAPPPPAAPVKPAPPPEKTRRSTERPEPQKSVPAPLAASAPGLKVPAAASALNQEPKQEPAVPAPAAPEPAASTPALSSPAPQPAPSAKPSLQEPADQSLPKVDVKARVRYVPSPILPALYRDDRAFVHVVVAVKVSEYGKVTEALLEESNIDSSSRTPPQVVREAALEAARLALFQPAQRNGKPVPYWTGLTFEWGQRAGAVISEPPGKADAKAQLISVPLPSERDLDHPARFLVAVQIDEQGKVMKTHLENVLIEGNMEKSSRKALQEDVLKAASQALFKPALQKGKPVTSWYLMKFEMGPKTQRP